MAEKPSEPHRDAGGYAVKDWNVVVTLYQDEHVVSRARQFLWRFDGVEPTKFRNVVVMRVASIDDFLRDSSAAVDTEPGIFNDISRVVPLRQTFDFAGAEAFESQAREIAVSFVPQLRGRSFYVRLHRRGLRSDLASPKEERFLDEALLAALDEAGAPGHIRFEDPDALIDVETVGHRAGLSLWTRDDLKYRQYLRVD